MCAACDVARTARALPTPQTVPEGAGFWPQLRRRNRARPWPDSRSQHLEFMVGGGLGREVFDRRSVSHRHVQLSRALVLLPGDEEVRARLVQVMLSMMSQPGVLRDVGARLARQHMVTIPALPGWWTGSEVSGRRLHKSGAATFEFADSVGVLGDNVLPPLEGAS